ncbi:MAG: hypothetical protein NUW23_01330 [Firmicutes bacterium]|jgi:hypothetical protein|nr:hypothetical protein [Bacillota bacterium]
MHVTMRRLSLTIVATAVAFVVVAVLTARTASAAAPEGFTLRGEFDARYAFGNLVSDPVASWNLRLSGDLGWAILPGLNLTARAHAAASFLDLQPELGVDRLFVQYEAGRTRLTMGRQAINWGLATMFRPTDLITPRDPTTSDESRPGKVLATLYWRTSPVTGVELVAGEDVYAVRAGVAIGQTNMRVLGVSQPGARHALGVDFEGGLGGLYGEACYDWADGAPEDYSTAGTLGWKKAFGSGKLVFAEYHRKDVRQGGIHLPFSFAAAGITYPLDEFTTASAALVADLRGGTKTATGTLSMLVADDLDLNFGVVVSVVPSGGPSPAGAGGAGGDTRLKGQAMVGLRWYL